MKKLYSIVLMAAVLLIGTTAWAVDVATWAELQEAIATPNAEINLTASVSMPAGEWDFNGATIICGNNKNNDFRVNAGTANGVYTLRNVTFKNYKYSSPKGAIYTTKAGTGIVLNLESSVHFEGNKYDVCLYNNLTVNNEATINSIYLQRGGTINNDGVIVTGVYGAGTGTGATTINNHAGASLTQTYGFKYAVTINNEGDAVISGGTASANMTANNVIISGGTRNAKLIGTDVTIKGGTFKGEISGTGYTINSGTFNVAPAAGTEGLIQPTEYGYAKFLEGVGSLDIASGFSYRAYDKMVVRNDAGVVQVTRGGSSFTCLVEEAFANAQDGDVITLIEDVTSYSSLWLGTAAQEDAKISLTLDLNGHTLNSAKNVKRTIELTHGALHIINSVPGQGGIKHHRSNTGNNSSDVIYVCGSTLKNVNPRTAAIADLFTYLLVDEGVKIIAEGDLVNGISLVENSTDGNNVSGVNYNTTIYKDYLNWSGEVNKQMGVANGVRIDIKGNIDVQKYGVKPNGNLRSSLEFLPEHAADGIEVNDTSYSAFIHIFPTAVVRTSNVESAAAVYASGYARWLIEGTCQGATGVYAKSGLIDFTDAIIESTYTGEATISTGKGSGIAAGGNAVVIESNGHYTGDHSLVVNGDTKISTEAEGGAAVVDVVDANHESKVSDITINGGSFTGDNAIVISSETASEQVTTVNGVTVTGQITVGGSSDPADVADIMGTNTHTTEIENPDGSKTVVVSAGAAPAAATEWVDVAALAEGSDAKWTGFTPGVIASGATVKLGELQIVSGNVTDGVQQLTIESNATLKVDRLIMNDFARIIVEAGGKLIVEGTQGINAPVVDNIVLRTQEGNPAIFLFNPAVSSNRHPNATVEFLSKSYTKSSSDYAKQRFGIPTHTALTDIKAKYAGSDVATGFEYFDYAANQWKAAGYINVAGQTMNYDKMAQPFAYYQMQHNTPNTGTIVTMKGELVGNTNGEMHILGNFWNGLANSYMAPINAEQLIEMIPNSVQKAFYLYDINDESGQSAWFDVTLDFLTDIQPMQPFMIRNTRAAADVTINYGDAVYYPTTGETKPNAAPARRKVMSNITKAQIIVKGENCIDRVGVVESDEFSSAFDNGHETEKYMNNDVNMYISADEKMGTYATDVLENTYIGFQSANGGKYTLSFANVRGKDLTLIDHETGARVIMVVGNEYEFTTDANYANDYRFEIVGTHNAPTAIDNVDAAKSVKGVYTITGQYMGELNVWNSLPAGVYVVNGEKRVK